MAQIIIYKIVRPFIEEQDYGVSTTNYGRISHLKSTFVRSKQEILNEIDHAILTQKDKLYQQCDKKIR